MTPNTVTLTLGADVGSTSTTKCVKFGRICIILISVNINSNAPANAELFTGAPAPMTGIGAVGALNGIGKSLPIAVNSYGKGYVDGTPASNTGWMNGVLVYATNS